MSTESRFIRFGALGVLCCASIGATDFDSFRAAETIAQRAQTLDELRLAIRSFRGNTSVVREGLAYRAALVLPSNEKYAIRLATLSVLLTIQNSATEPTSIPSESLYVLDSVSLKSLGKFDVAGIGNEDHPLHRLLARKPRLRDDWAGFYRSMILKTGSEIVTIEACDVPLGSLSRVPQIAQRTPISANGSDSRAGSTYLFPLAAMNPVITAAKLVGISDSVLSSVTRAYLRFAAVQSLFQAVQTSALSTERQREDIVRLYQKSLTDLDSVSEMTTKIEKTFRSEDRSSDRLARAIADSEFCRQLCYCCIAI